MKYWYQRIELWVLVILVGGGLAWALTHRGSEAQPDTAAGGSNGSADDNAQVKILRCTVKRDFGYAHLDIDAHVRNDQADKLVMQSPKVKLLTGKGREAPAFFLPFDKLPEVAPHSANDVQLRYWLEAADFAGPLTLEMQGKSWNVKGSKPLDWNALKNGVPRSFAPGQW